MKNNPDWVLRIKVYECQSLMFTKVKGNIEKAVQMLMVLHERGNKNFVPALLAMAQAFVLQKQITKAQGLSGGPLAHDQGRALQRACQMPSSELACCLV